MTTTTRIPPLARRALVVAALSLSAAATAAQETAPPEPVSEELLVVEKSILLQRETRAAVDNLEVAVGGVLGEALAVYRVGEVDFPSTLYFDLCRRSFTRLAKAVGMVAAVSEQMLEAGPVSVATGGKESLVLLEESDDSAALSAALTVVLRSALGGCADDSPLAGLGRLRQTLSLLEQASSAPSLLVVYAFNPQAVTAEELQRFAPDFTRAGRELAGQGRTTVVLVPQEGDTTLRPEEIEPLLGDPEGPPRTIDLGALLGALLRSKRTVPADSRTLALAVDPRSDLLRGLIVPGSGRLFAFPRQLEAFALEMSQFQILYYRTLRPKNAQPTDLTPIEVRLRRSGETVESATLTSLGAPRPGR